MNLRVMFDIIDDNLYVSNPKMDARIYFIRKALDAKTTQGFKDKDIILDFCKKDNVDEYTQEILDNLSDYTSINYEEIGYINQKVEDKLRYAFIYDHKDALYNALERLDASQFDNTADITEEITSICTNILTASRKLTTKEAIESFSLEQEEMITAVNTIVDNLKNNSYILKTGLRSLNEITSGGFYSKKLYTFMACPANFKSGLLLKCCRDIKKYNKGIKTKSGKRPCVLMVVLENTVEETIERLFSMVGTENVDMRNYSAAEVIKILREQGGMVLEDADDINIVIKYYPNMAINTEYLYTLIDDLYDEGNEVVALILDYIKRIKSTERAKDEKEELKHVTNELKSLAQFYNMPVITAHQINRAGAAALDAAKDAGKEDLAKFMGRSNVGTAWEVQENSDFACLINLEQKRSTGQYYLTFSRTKMRYRPSELTYFNQPFMVNNRMALIDDINLDRSLAEASLKCDFNDMEGTSLDAIGKGRRTATVERLVLQDDCADAEDNGIFDFSSAINKKIA